MRSSQKPRRKTTGLRSPWPGRWSPICSPWNAGRWISCLPKNSQAQPQHEKRFQLRKEQKHQDSSMRRLPGPADCRLGNGGNSKGSLGLFRDWQRTQTQSSVRALRSLRQQMDVRFCESRSHQPRGKYCEWESSDHNASRALLSAPRNLVLFS
jgi:hypothetical protein